MRLAVRIASACGAPQASICEQIINPETRRPIDQKTLRKVFRVELDTATEYANSRVAQSLFSKAIGTGPQSVTAAIFWLKTRAGWKETSILELLGRTSDEELNRIIAESAAEAGIAIGAARKSAKGAPAAEPLDAGDSTPP